MDDVIPHTTLVKARIAWSGFVDGNCRLLTDYICFGILRLHVACLDGGWDRVVRGSDGLRGQGWLGRSGARFVSGLLLFSFELFHLLSRFFVAVEHAVTEVEQQTCKRTLYMYMGNNYNRVTLI